MIKLVTATDMDGTFLDEAGLVIWSVLKLSSHHTRERYLFCCRIRSWSFVLRNILDVKDEIIFIAENGSLAHFHGQDLYEANHAT